MSDSDPGDGFWARCDHPSESVDRLTGPGQARKRRLLACAFCRTVREVLRNQYYRAALETAERFADGECDAAELEARNYDVSDLLLDPRYVKSHPPFPSDIQAALLAATASDPDIEWLDQLKSREVAPVLYCQFGDPLHPLDLCRPWWRDKTSVRLARSIYSAREWDQMPLLADALEEAGCEDTNLLRHCRGGEPHSRGCHVVDGLLGKAAPSYGGQPTGE
jgi:hypothetical protein